MEEPVEGTMEEAPIKQDSSGSNDDEAEIASIGKVYAALKGLDREAQSRVLNYVAGKLKIAFSKSTTSESSAKPAEKSPEINGPKKEIEVEEEEFEEDDELAGISSGARKWIKRNGFETNQLSKIFSIGADEIDLVAKSVPGPNKKERMKNVFLLQGIAAYLGSGTARFTHSQAKEACSHYDAYDSANFAAYFKSLSGEVGGSKEQGYSLNLRGLTAGTELIKSMLGLTKTDH
jgi:hypothetical protein